MARRKKLSAADRAKRSAKRERRAETSAEREARRERVRARLRASGARRALVEAEREYLVHVLVSALRDGSTDGRIVCETCGTEQRVRTGFVDEESGEPILAPCEGPLGLRCRGETATTLDAYADAA